MSPCALAMQEEKENGCEVIWERVQAADGDGIWNRPDQNNNMAKNVSINKHDSNWKNSGGSPSHDMFFAQTIEWCFMFNDEVIGKWCYFKWMDYSAVVFFPELDH